MSNQSVITSIVKLYKLISLIIEVDCTNFEDLPDNQSLIKLKNQQIKLELLNHKLYKGFSWYCGSSMKLVAKSLANYNSISYPSNSTEYTSLIKKASILNQLIEDSIIANYDYKDLFTEISAVLENKIELIDEELVMFECETFLSVNL